MDAQRLTAAWTELAAQASRLGQTRIAGLFDDAPDRAARYSCSAAGISMHFAKQRLDEEAFAALLALAEAAELPAAIARLFAGETVNLTEGRAALHMALRAAEDEQWFAAGTRVDESVREVRDAFLTYASAVRSGAAAAVDGRAFTDVVNIGIGGSDLGPRMVCEALAAQADGPRVHFIANVDPEDRAAVLGRCNPARTLVVITSKTFTTQETMANAHAVRQWLVDALGEAAIARHCAAVSTNIPAVVDFGVARDRIFGFWDWVGGRYSLWSAVGLPVAMAIGPQAFHSLLAGARDMDQHFREAPLADNLPVIAGLLGVWNRNGLGAESQVVVPYAQRLRSFVGWLQQLEMESNGKSVRRDGSAVTRATTPALWGDVGSNAQHAFFQMLHQGSSAHPVDFILPLRSSAAGAGQQRLLIANCLAQASALMRGRDRAQAEAALLDAGMAQEQASALAPHRCFPGDRPSTMLLLPRLDAYYLGALLAFYEHRTFVQSVLWDINAFDQWGVELGKQLAGTVDAALAGGDGSALDPDTRQLVQLALKSDS